MSKRRKFRNEDEEREYWATHDSADEVNWSKAARTILPNLKPSVRTISLRLPESMLEALKNLANKQDVPYQSLIKVFLSERIDGELRKDFEPRRAVRRRHNKALHPTKPSRALGSRG
jgi:predicted DNA binding CopG/RHH family protein